MSLQSIVAKEGGYDLLPNIQNGQMSRCRQVFREEAVLTRFIHASLLGPRGCSQYLRTILTNSTESSNKTVHTARVEINIADQAALVGLPIVSGTNENIPSVINQFPYIGETNFPLPNLSSQKSPKLH